MKQIDAVITWVDGEDSAFRTRCAEYAPADFFQMDEVAGKTRFSSLGEIFWCVASLNRFAPFLHRIYIVTDRQDPHLEDFLQRNFPQGHIPVEIVDHQVIFRDYEQYLPTFNSLSIETMTWRIPGLSEYYIELNDDFLLTAPATPEDFFTEDGKVVCYAATYDQFWIWLTRKLKKRVHGHRRFTFKGAMLNAAHLAGQCGYLFRIDHTPRALRKSVYGEYFTAHPEALLRNIQYRFRDADQFTPQELHYLLLNKMGKCRRLPVNGNLFFLQPKPVKGYVSRKLNRLRRNPSYRFCCFNSFDKATPAEQQDILAWIEGRLQIRL